MIVNNSIKILIIAPNIHGKGGTETVLSKVMNYSHYRYHIKWSLLLPDGHVDPKWTNFLIENHHNVDIFETGRLMKIVREVIYLIFDQNDIVLSLGTKTLYLAWIIRKLFFKKYKIVSWIHFDISHAYFVNTKYFKYADHNLAISEGVKKDIVSLGVPADKTSTIFNPVDKQTKTISKSKNCNHFIYIGRIDFEGQKNIKLLIDALALIPREFKFKVDFIGSGNDQKKCQKYAKQKISDNACINWIGWKSDPWKEVKEADLLLLSSRFEGFGMVVAEAISYGIPVVAPNISGPDDLIKEGVNGYLFKKYSAEAMRNNILKEVNKRSRSSSEVIKNTLESFYDNNYYKKFEKSILLGEHTGK
ncbi:putative Lipopolysaccharide 1,6-galactosyltransferase [Oenococcus oeni]|uniref:glycosyltransferase n=1 Tax=Oenococcus oeni TaxID=1247 RepID=UPI0010B67F11|nr:glycosyltransferase [Oenococcus oeni]SYW05549.1 putative Lipopolysaccharide 1,6-galactosyltransferase [Oenococcus oeni]